MVTIKRESIRCCLLFVWAIALLGLAQSVHAQVLDPKQFEVNPWIFAYGSDTPLKTTALPDYVAKFYGTNGHSFYCNRWDNTAGFYIVYMQNAELTTALSALGSITAGDTYRVTWNYKVDNSADTSLGGSGVVVQWYDANKIPLSTTTLAQFPSSNGPTTFTAESQNTTAPSGAAYAGIRWYSYEQTYVSAFQLTDVTLAGKP